MPPDFWDSIAAAHRVDGGADADRPILDPDPLESEPESDEEDRTDGIFSPQFVQSTGVHVYMKMCREHNVVPVQQFISMLDHEVVSLKHRGVGAAGGKAIFECLRHNKHIQALDIEDNQLGLNVNVEAGALEHISAAIRDNQVLTNLDLSYNNFAGRGCAALAEALESNGRIRELSLRGNNMGDIGARALRGNLNEKSRLSKIDVSDNGIGESGGQDLGLLIANTQSLKQARIRTDRHTGTLTHSHIRTHTNNALTIARSLHHACRPTFRGTPSARKALSGSLRDSKGRRSSSGSTSPGTVWAIKARSTWAAPCARMARCSSWTYRAIGSACLALGSSRRVSRRTRRYDRCSSTATLSVTRASTPSSKRSAYSAPCVIWACRTAAPRRISSRNRARASSTRATRRASIS